MSGREKWIDILKGIAIIAVVFDHVFFLFPDFRSGLWWQHTFFSITWFVFLSGVANGLSAGKKKDWIFPKSYFSYWKKRISIIYPYFLATIISMFLLFPRMVNLLDVLLKIVNFSTLPTFYFINLILQLYLIFPFVYSLFRNCKTPWQKTGLFFSVLLVSVLADYIKPVWPFSPAGKYFGSIYLAVFCFGMLFTDKKFISNKLLFFVSLFTFTIYELLLWNTKGSFISNSPNINQVFWSLSLLFLAKKIVDKIDIKQPVMMLLELLGHHTLFIYLFHFTVLLKLKNIIDLNSWLDIFFAVLTSIFISIIIEYLYKKFIWFVRSQVFHG